jgi:ribosomal protein L11 methyltransferase
LKDENWNRKWEENFQPITIGDIHVRASFHAPQPAKREIIIEPKMSFGTGHHATTSLMIQEMLKTDCTGRNVLDMGCGTSILAILASMLGAKEVTAVDVDDWAVENSKENLNRNEIKNVTVLKGDAEIIGERPFDVVLANINRNVLLNDMWVYSRSLNRGGRLLLSGFYEEDVKQIKKAAEENGLTFINYEVSEHWTMARFSKA